MTEVFGIPYFILLVIALNAAVVALFAYHIITSRKNRTSRTEPREMASVPWRTEGKTLHRCPNCNSLFETPWKEIVYITDPPTEKLICPFCQRPLRVEVEGKLKLGLPEAFDLEPTIPPARKMTYNIVVSPDSIADVTNLLAKKGFKPELSYENGEFRITVTSDRELSFAKLQEAGKILRWEKIV